MTADQLLDKLAREGGVIVSSGVMTASGIAQAQACGRFYVNQDHLGFAHLPNCIAHPRISRSMGPAAATTSHCPDAGGIHETI